MSSMSNALPTAWNVSAADSFDAFLARLSPKARLSVDKHTEACDGDANLAYGRAWRRVVATLGRLAPHHVEVSAPFAVRFFIADGRYRQQVFAIEDARKGTIQVYMPDITPIALSRDLLLPSKDARIYPIAADPKSTISLEIVTSDSAEIPAYLKPMLGWGRRALKTTVEANATETQVALVEALCEIAAETWKDKQPAVQAAP